MAKNYVTPGEAAKHDRDENAARNILVAGGHTETLNGQVGKQPDYCQSSSSQRDVNPHRSYGSVVSPCL